MSPTNNFVRVLDVNPIVVRALEAELRVAERRCIEVITWDIQRLAKDIESHTVGNGPHMERLAAARKLLDDAAANYLAVKSELDHARKPVELPTASPVLTTTTFDGGDGFSGIWKEATSVASSTKKRPAGPSSLRRPRQHKRGK